MGLITLEGSRPLIMGGHEPFPSGASASHHLMDAATEKLHMTGYAWGPALFDGSSKNIVRVLYHPNAITKGATTDVRISLQDTVANEYPARGDGTQDQYVDIGNANLTTGWKRSDAFASGAYRTVSLGTKFTVVFEFTTFEAGDAFRLTSQANTTGLVCATLHDTVTPTYTAVATMPNLVFECSDGSYLWFHGGCPWETTVGSHTTGSTTNPNERGNLFTIQAPTICVGARVYMRCDVATSDYECALYSNPLSSPTKLAYQTVDAAHIVGTSSYAWFYHAWAPQTLMPGTYGITVTPSSTNAIRTIYHTAYSDALRAMVVGVNHGIYRNGGSGDFTAELTKWFLIEPILIAIDGTGLIRPNLSGGL